MITKISKSVEDQFPAIRKKWVDIGLSTGKVDRSKVNEALDRMFAVIGKKRPKFTIILRSPIEVVIAIAMLRSGDAIAGKFKNQVSDQVLDQVRDQVFAQVFAQVLAQVSDQVSDQVSEIINNRWWYGFGQFEAYWLSFYDVCSKAGADAKNIIPQMEFCQEAGWAILFWDWAFVSEKIAEIHRNERGQLHCETGPALAYSDGFSVYALNGIRMKAEYVMTPSGNLAPDAILKEANADIRRELIRKVGIERMLSKLPHKVLDKKGDYEVLSVDFPDLVRDARFLKMRNPSMDVWHMEGVERECATVEQAINWRAGVLKVGEWTPEVLT
jgi:hypothetical protein